MGYGHLRAIYPLKALSKGGKILDVNTSAYSTVKERRLWKEMLGTYEFMSRAGKLPLLDLKKSIRRGLCKGILDETKWPELPNDNLILFISYSC